MPSGVGKWNRVLSPETGTWGFETTFTGATYEFNFTSDEADAAEVKRALGGLIMATLPEGALDQALSTLYDYYTFYLEDQQLDTVGGDLVLTTGQDSRVTEASGLAIGYSVP